MSISAEELASRVAEINVWRKGDERAPHKPLLLLLALARVQNREPRLARYRQLDEHMRRLLLDFGPSRQSVHPEYPFWRLQRDGLWDVPQHEALVAARGDRARTGDIPKSLLLDQDATGGFTSDVQALLEGDPGLTNQLATSLLEAHFAPSLHADLMNAVGLQWVPETRQAARRDPEFRITVTRVYEYRCAVCGFDGRLGSSQFALEAAHIKWHAAGGPDTVDNGIALCSLHHKALDRGAWGLDGQRMILVSQELHGSALVDEMFLRFSGEPLRPPIAGQDQPAAAFCDWHRREVFKEPAR